MRADRQEGMEWRHWWQSLEPDHIADRPGTKKVPGPKKLIFDFSKGFLHRAMIKFEADPVVGYKQREARSDGESTLPGYQ
jgi:hypothetical protein